MRWRPEPSAYGLAPLLAIWLLGACAPRSPMEPPDHAGLPGRALEVSGLVFEFGGAGKVVANADVCVIEPPNRGCVKTGPDGVYHFPIHLNPSSPTPVTVVLGELRYHSMRGPTLVLEPRSDPAQHPELSTWHLQSVIGPLYTAYKEAVARAAREQLRANRCQVAGTVADFGKAHHYAPDPETGGWSVDYAGFLADTVHGFAGARVRLYAEAADAPEGWVEVLGHGPIYSSDRVLPRPPDELSLTSGDGGFFFYNLDEGRYRVVAEDAQAGHAAGHAVPFSGPLIVDCTRDREFVLPGVFVNIAPPALAALEEVPMYPRPEVQPLHLPELPRLPELPKLDALQLREERRRPRP